MSLQDQLSLQHEFEAAVTRVNGLPGDKAAAHMTELYGLYKQATEGDHDTRDGAIGDDSPDMPSGYQGMSQAQWDSWSRFKGTSEDDAKRQYIQKVNDIAGPVGEDASVNTGNGQPALGSQVGSGDKVPGNEAPAPGTAKAPYENEGGQSMGGLRGDINDGAPYGGEDRLKTQQ
ncbi:acyl-CoA-binding protein [Hymenobacter koreensis]|uniref:ACB domain-containing protein n=1 Tax=Hymenobacter koreensis TaxID=1084523 RepID=A0ABP8IU99_9BACT